MGVFERLFAKMKDIEGSEEAALAAMIEISSRPSLFKKFNFGKYLGKSLEEVAGTDRGYLEWLLKQKKENNSEDVDWIYTLTHYLQK